MNLFKTKKMKQKSITDTEFARAIIEIFEEKLDELDITLPDKLKLSEKNQARIFGNNYFDLEDQISELIRLNKKQLIENIT